jgi:hypothetical protein
MEVFQAFGLDGLGFHGISGAAHGADDILHVGEVQRLAQATDMDIDGAFVDIDVMTPDAVE